MTQPRFPTVGRLLVEQIITNIHSYEWTLQGFGMARAYLPGAGPNRRDVRVNIWDSNFRVDDVDDIHTHPWDFTSMICVGELTNTLFKVKELGTVRGPITARTDTIIPGSDKVFDGDPVPWKEADRVTMEIEDEAVYREGETYSQQRHEIHRTATLDGTVTLNWRFRGSGPDVARVFWEDHRDWVPARPWPAGPADIERLRRIVTERWLS